LLAGGFENPKSIIAELFEVTSPIAEQMTGTEFWSWNKPKRLESPCCSPSEG
jgi:hypothetical protein